MIQIHIPRALKNILMIVGSVVIAGLVATNVVLASATDNFFGYAWSTNIGWVKVNNCTSATDCPPGVSYGLTMASSGAQRAITGYAWSSNIGWITFNTQRQSSGYDVAVNCPPTLSGGTNCDAYVDWGASGGIAVPVKGWARACSVYIDCTDPSRGLKETYETGNWDGWIALGDTDTSDSVSYGVKLNTTTGQMSGYAWGSGVVGWVDFSGVTIVDDCTRTGICPPPVCPNGTPAPGGDTANCFCPDGVTPMPPTGICIGDPTCPNGTPVPPSGICVPDPTCPNGTPIPPSGVCSSNPPQCSDGIDNDGDGTIDFPADPGCTDPNDDDETDSNCTVVGSPCWCLNNGNPPAQCGGGPGTVDLCTNIPGVQTLIVPPMRPLTDGRCLCMAGYVLNAQYQCVKPVYIEPKQ